MRIAFILPTFAAGGAERVASLLCNYWAEQGHDVTALTFEGAGDEQIYRLDDRVTLRGIDALNRNRRLTSRVRTNVRRLVPPPRRSEGVPAGRSRGLHHRGERGDHLVGVRPRRSGRGLGAQPA